MTKMRKVMLAAEIALVASFSFAVYTVVPRVNALLDSTTKVTQSVDTLVKKITKDEDESKRLLNASLIHLDLVLGNMARASHNQDKVSEKALRSLDGVQSLLSEAQVSLRSIQGVTLATTETIRSAQPVLEEARLDLVALNNNLATLNSVQNDVRGLLVGDDTKAIVGNLKAVSASMVVVGEELERGTKETADTTHNLSRFTNVIAGRAEDLNKPKKLGWSSALTILRTIRDIRQAFGI